MNIRKYIATAATVTLSILIVNHALADEEETDVDPEVKALITPQSEISIGADYMFDDASRFGKYNGMPDDGAYLVLDLNLVNRDDETGTWLKLTGKNLGLDNRELRFEHERQGDWGYFIDFSQTPRVNPLTIVTGLTGIGTDIQAVAGTALREVELETERDRLKFGLGKQLGYGFDVKIGFSREEKNGERQWGAQGTGQTLNFLTEPIDYVHNEFNGQLNFTSARLQMSGGYLGSLFSNKYEVVTNDSSQKQIALPLDNQAHQLFLTGGYSVTPTTRVTFKASHGRTYQEEDYFEPAGFAGNNSTSLDGELWNTLVHFGLSSRPLQDLNVNVKLRFEDRDDRTPRKQYINPDATQDGFNVTQSRSTGNADLKIGYRLPQKFRLTGGVGYEHWTRSNPPRRQVSFRRTTEELSYRIKLRRSLSETLGGSIGYVYSDRTGDDYKATGSLEVIDPIIWADRERHKGRLSLDWLPIDRFSMQFLSEYSLDSYNGRRLGPRDGSAFLVSIDANYEIADEWNLTAWVSHSNTKMDQATNCSTTSICGGTIASTDWFADLTQNNSAVGLGLRGMVTDRMEAGIDAQFSFDQSEYEIETIGGTPLSDLPDIDYNHVRVSLFTDYTINENSRLQITYSYDWNHADDWTWNGFTYADGTTVSIPTTQDTHIIGLTYSHRF